MPGLTRLRLQTGNFLKHGHGVSWRRINFFLSLPGLREFQLVGLCVCPSLPDRPRVKSLAPVASLQYNLRNHRSPWKLPDEDHALGLLMGALHNTLQSLILPAEQTPVLALSRLHWPRLRELKIFGERWSSPDTPLISLLANLPNLQIIVFAFSDPENQSEDARAVCPVGFDSSFPWPVLQHLTLSHPSTKDAIYARLPPTLQTLALRSWTHHCVRSFIIKRVCPHLPSMFPLGTASTLRRVLRDVRIQELRTLELEYRADADDLMLLEDVVSWFPKLDTIELHRYRQNGVKDVPLDDIANILRPLAQLRTAKLNVDFHASVFYSEDSSLPHEQRVRNPSEILRSCVLTFARVCSSLQEVWVLFDRDHILKWCCYHIVRHREEDNAQLDMSRYEEVSYNPRR
ncbi:hypothetical protein C8Q80DRAFT_679354 [Daedaleopsis nitida]|nr:hypothetical protein C8Q80DRAFT_679354 [Daedaleopsis nitida]